MCTEHRGEQRADMHYRPSVTMEKQVRTTLMVLMGLLCMPAVLADDCAPYVGSDYQLHRGQNCVLLTCSGTCTNRYCGLLPLDQGQFMCIVNNLYFVIGCGLVASLLFVVGVIACCCKTLCFCCGLCCEQQPQTRVISSRTVVTNVIPPQPMVQVPYSSPPYSSSPAGYQPVPSQSSYLGQHDKPGFPPLYPGADNAAFVESP